jgi:hypothetical protein
MRGRGWTRSGVRTAVVVSALLLTAAAEAAAQTSVFGIRGLGHPGRMESARGRGLGGGFAALDPGSPVNPAAVAGVGPIRVQLLAETDLRGYQIGGVSVDGLSSTRFPLGMVSGRIASTPFSFALSYTQYTERSYDLTNSDTIEIRGAPVGYEERTTSRGGMSDLRLALGYLIGSRVRLGVAGHLLTGSAKLQFQRTFADSAYRAYQVETDEQLDGLGVSIGAMWTPLPRLALGLTARSDTRAEITVDSAVVGSVDLPVTLAGGLQFAPARPVRLSATATWQSWGGADADLSAHAFDTWALGLGLELGGPETGVSRLPLRLGYRYATLPVSPTDDQPTEATFALGAGGTFAGGRGIIDLAVERVYRNGGGARETAWQMLWMVTVRP